MSNDSYRSSNSSSPESQASAPRSDVATVCSSSVVGDIDGIVASAAGELPAVAADHQQAATASRNVPPLHPAAASALARSSPSINMGPPLNRTLLIQRDALLEQQHRSSHNHGSQSGSSVKSYGSFTGSEGGGTGPASPTGDDIDCGGSLDVEAHSVGTTRSSLHSGCFQDEHHHEQQRDSLSPSLGPASPRETADNDERGAFSSSTSSRRDRSRSRSPDEAEETKPRARRSDSSEQERYS